MTRFFILSISIHSFPMAKEKRSITENISAFFGFLKAKSPKFLQPHLNKGNFIIALVVLFFLAQYLQISSMTGGFSSLSMSGSSLVDEVGKLNQVVSNLGQDLNEVRGFLAMPTRKYSDLQDTEIVDTDANQDTLQLALFKYVNYVGEQEKLNKKTTDGLSNLKSLTTDKALKEYIAANNLVLGLIEDSAKDWHVSLSDGKASTIVYLSLDKATGDLSWQTVEDKNVVELLENETLASYVGAFLQQNLQKITDTIKALEDKKAYITKSLQNESIIQLLDSRQLLASAEPVTENFKFYYQIKNESKEVVAEIILDKKDLSVQLKDARDSDKVAVKVTDLVSAIPPFIEKLDTIPEVQKKVMEAKLKMSETLDDKGFKLLLKNLNLSISKETREDEYRYYYDIYTVLTGNTKLLGSVVIEKTTGIINVVDPNGTSTTNILFFDPGLKKKL